MDDVIRPMADEGVALRRAGYAVLPAKGKRPIIKSFSTFRAPPSEKTIAKWAEKCPEADLVYMPGLSGPKGLVVVDADSAAAFEACIARFGDTPGKVATRRGMHLLYRADGRDMPSEVGRQISSLKEFGIDADVKHGRHIVVAPPSWHETDWRFQYKWHECDSGVIRDVPSFRYSALRALVAEKSGAPSQTTRDASMRAPFRDGSRGLKLNDYIFTQAANFGFDTFDDMLDEARTWNETMANHGLPPLDEAEVLDRTKQVWADYVNGEIVPWKGHRGTSMTDADEVRAITGRFKNGSDVVTLVLLLRAEHSARVARGETFYLSIKAMVEGHVIGDWAAARYRNARDNALEMGLIRFVEFGPDGNARYTLGERALTPSIAKREKAQNGA